MIHQVRPHVGQRRVAERLRSLLHSSVYPSEIAGKSGVSEWGNGLVRRKALKLIIFLILHFLTESHRFCNRVQDSYTLRCCPQVGGLVNISLSTGEGTIKKQAHGFF